VPPGRMDRPQQVQVRELEPVRAPGLERPVHRTDHQLPERGLVLVLLGQEPPGLARRTDRWQASAWDPEAPSGRRL
jgi:hypothetical protein